MEDDAEADRYPAIELLIVWEGGEDVLWSLIRTR